MASSVGGRPVPNHNWSEGCAPYVDRDPGGASAHDLPHTYLGLDWDCPSDDGLCCQFVSGRQRCQGTRSEHRSEWRELNP